MHLVKNDRGITRVPSLPALPVCTTLYLFKMTEAENVDTPQDEYEDMPGGPGAPIPVSQLVVSTMTLEYHALADNCRAWLA